MEDRGWDVKGMTGMMFGLDTSLCMFHIVV